MPHFFFKILQVWCSNFCGQLKIYSSSPLFLSGFFFKFLVLKQVSSAGMAIFLAVYIYIFYYCLLVLVQYVVLGCV